MSYIYNDEDNVPMNEEAVKVGTEKNCHERCRFGKICSLKGDNSGEFPDECGMYYKFEDLESDARDILREQRRARGEDEEDW